MAKKYAKRVLASIWAPVAAKNEAKRKTKATKMERRRSQMERQRTQWERRHAMVGKVTKRGGHPHDLWEPFLIENRKNTIQRNILKSITQKHAKLCQKDAEKEVKSMQKLIKKQWQNKYRKNQEKHEIRCFSERVKPSF
jgi:hypothetical protein